MDSADRVERPRKEKFKSEMYSGEELEQLFKFDLAQYLENSDELAC